MLLEDYQLIEKIANVSVLAAGQVQLAAVACGTLQGSRQGIPACTASQTYANLSQSRGS